MTGKDIVQALRCCAKGLGHDDACENCKVEEIQDRREYIEFAAANVIERMTSENAALREKQRWVLVTERLPEKQQRVIVRCKTVGTTVGWIMFGEWVTDLGPGCGEVTHWMPLPGAPEAHNGKENS